MSTIVSGYINQIAEQSSESKRYIYRGQSKIYDGITSTAKRRFKHSDLTPNEDEYFEYHTNLIKDARSYRYGQELELNDTELLIDLQHYGAATGLIDFSEDLLIALWFACDKLNENGEVFFLDVWTDQFKHLVSGGDLFNEKEKEKDKTKPPHYYLHTNFKSNARISAQKGVFIFGYQDIDNVASITIKKGDKVYIRQELKQYFNIEEKTLFQDIYGFAQVNNTKHKLSIKTAIDYFQEAYEEDNAEQAIVLYKKAIEIKPDKHEAYYNMGNAYGKLGEYQKAINAYQKAIEIKPDDNKAYYNMGNAYDELKEYQKAINAYQKAIEIKPDYDGAYNNMGVAYNKLKEYQKAINVYQKAIEIKPDNHGAYYNMGNAYGELKEYQKAINAYQKASAILPSLIDYAKKQNFDLLESYINNLDDSPVKQQNLFILNQLQGHD